jgi:hypothetical protein
VIVRLLLIAVLALAGALIAVLAVAAGPDVARYLRIREM